MVQKTATVVVIVLLIGTLGATVVGASGFLNSRRQVTFADLVNQWEDLQAEKQQLHDLIEGYGVELPDISVAQKREILRTIHLLKRQGAAREQIREAVVDLLIGYGVDLPDLTSEQRAEIRERIKTLLEEDYGFVFVELTEEQQTEIKQTVRQMKKNYASRAQIKQAIIDLYEGYGGVIPTLSDEQREEIYDQVVLMLETDYDVEVPDLTFEQRQTIREKSNEIAELRNELRQMFNDARFRVKIRFLRYLHRTIE